MERLPRASWWLVVATSGLFGYGLAAQRIDQAWQALSQLASLGAGLVYFVLALVSIARAGTEWAWLRGALATTLVLVGGSYFALIGGDASHGYSLLEHVVVPVLVTLDYVALGSNPGRRWWPLTWLLLPLAYLVYYVSDDLLLYDFLDPYSPGYHQTVLEFLVATAVIGYAVWGLRRARVAARSSRSSSPL
jgi:hypothetical protein